MTQKTFSDIKKMKLETRDEKYVSKPGRQSITDNERQKVSYFFDRDLWKRLGKIAIDKETTRTELIHEAVREWLNRNE